MRPILLVYDVPSPANLSTRKLVLEAAKFNVVTVTSSREALDTMRRFDLDGVVLSSELEGDCDSLLMEIRKLRPNTKLIVDDRINVRGSSVDGVFERFDPVSLLDVARRLFGDPIGVEQEREERNALS